MITVYNDAKRTTLSAWSWPSRYVAGEMANNFKLHHGSQSDINLQYITPAFHKEFLDCIVVSDIETFKNGITGALATSLRIDGSVDRTQKHNVFVMTQIVKKDGSIGTLCIGFDVPKTNGALGYLQCLKNIVNKLLPWDHFFMLISSIVTDGENLNMGHLNGLVALLKRLRISDGLNLPLLSIWCVPHKTNLAWKSVSKINMVASLITRARKISKHFHDSAKRTQKLDDVALRNRLSKPLRYPSFFEVRWTEYVSNLFHAILRNYSASISYFQTENLHNHLQYWTQYDTLYSITFLTDMLSLIKRFQKTCQGDSITLIDVSRLSYDLFEKLERSKVKPIEGGWEELFLKNIVVNNNNVYFYGIKLSKVSAKRTRRIGISFTSYKRNRIIQSMVQHLKTRLALDIPLLRAFEPLVNIRTSTPQENLELCHRIIATDFEENIFKSEYHLAAKLLNGREFTSTLETLKTLIEKSPDQLNTIKVSLARISVAKPHSADVERLICMSI